jgi:adenosylcobinamide-GDP ribazoletransferase
MRALLIGLQFLTYLPIHNERVEARQLARSYYFYPLIGFLIGLAAVVLLHVLALVFPLSFTVTLVLAFLIWISGGLHEDGLADAADGMGGGWTRDQRLDIMKDRRIGAFGATVLILALLSKFAALTSMSASRLDAAIISAQILGRWVFLPLAYFNPPAREGLASQFMQGLAGRVVVAGTILSAGAVIFIDRHYGAVSLGVAAAIIVAASIYFRRRIGGLTGDCFGATFQFVEIATYAAFLT